MVAKLRIFSGISKEYFEVVDAEDAAVADFATLLRIEKMLYEFSDFQFAGGKYFDIAPTSVKIVAERYTISEVEDTPIRLPYPKVTFARMVQK